MPPDPFDLLGLPPGFDLDPAAVERAYLSRAAASHPDLSRADPEAARSSARLNQARRTLDDPPARAEALLARFGGPAPAADKSLPAGFLADMMATREEIEAALASGAPEARAERLAWAERRRAEHVRTVSGMFASLTPPPEPVRLRAIRVELNAWRYTERLIEQLAAP